MPQRAAGRSFRQINLVHTEDFGDKNEKIRSWVMKNGGTFSKEMNDGVTHLICSKKAWKEYRAIVRDARRRRIKIVTLDWLEDSLLSPSRRPKPEKKYEWDTISRKQREIQKTIEARNDQVIKESIATFDEQCLDFEATMQTTGYHIYSDPTGFSYSVILARTFLLENRLEKLTLKLFESDAMPHTYACYVKYSRRGVSGREILAIPGSSWQLAFDAFRKFFQTKTRKDWKDRLDGKPAPTSRTNNSDDDFRYEPPTGMRAPKGLVEKKTIRERVQEAQSGREDSVTMIVPTIAISDDDDDQSDEEKAHLTTRARTPAGTEW